MQKFEELSVTEMKELDGGFFISGSVIAAILICAFGAGVAIGCSRNSRDRS